MRDWVVVDTTRPEPLTPDPGDHRVMWVRAWYPADPAGAADAQRAPYVLHAAEAYRGISRSLGAPTFVVSSVARVVGNGRLDAAPASGEPWPWVLYSGGYRQGHPAHNTEVAEELASHGYVVVGLSHPYEEALTFREDGAVLTLDTAVVSERIARLFGERSPLGNLDYTTLASMAPGERAARIQAHQESLPVHQETARLWLEDTRSVLALVLAGRGEAGRFLRDLTDPEHLGMFGMSFGGSTAGLFCATEPRCRAGASLDGTQWGDFFGGGFRTPMLYMSQDFDTWNDFYYAEAGPDYHRVKVRGAEHGDFTDGLQSTPLIRALGILGPIGGERSRTILRAYVLAFFDRYLRGRRPALLDEPSPFPEVDHVVDPLGRGG